MSNSLTNRENFLKAVYKNSPNHVPIAAGYCSGAMDEASECKCVSYKISDKDWGYSFSRAESDTKTMGLVNQHPLSNESQILDWCTPDLSGENRFSEAAMYTVEFKENDLIVFGGTGSFLFERMHYLVGMENLFDLMYNEPEIFVQLGNKIVDFQCKVITEYAKIGVDGIWGGCDWGLQDRLMISPDFWRTHFKPWYTKMFKTAKSHGLMTYMHSCGKINEILGDLIECHLDVIELHQPSVFDVDWLSSNYGGKICFSTTPDIQVTLPYNDTNKIISEVKELKDKLGCFNGGLLYNIYPMPQSIDIPDSNMELYLQTAKEYGRYC